MNQTNNFITPTPKPRLMQWLGPLNNIFCLKGIPVLRDVPLLNKIPGIRGLAQVRHIDFPAIDRNRLQEVCGKNKATFLLPNHPEFFTDWMIDKYILSTVSPLAASWASKDMVNGMGKFMQRFWLNNNLVAQIPGNSKSGKNYSINSALAGNGVLLHPEGHVGWHSKHIAPLFSGSAQMAIDAYKQGVRLNDEFQSWLAPIVWKLRFNRNVKNELLRECQYIERRLELDESSKCCPAQRVYDIYLALAKREYFQYVDSNDSFADLHLFELQQKIIQKARKRLSSVMECHMGNTESQVREAKKWLRNNDAQNSDYPLVQNAVVSLNRWLRLMPCTFDSTEISQEETAEHLKRIRSDFCKGTLRDTISKYLPQAAASRTVHIRSTPPISINKLMSLQCPDPAKIMCKVRDSMQQRLDNLHQEIDHSFPRVNAFNPFYYAMV